MSAMIEGLKAKKFEWNKLAYSPFEEIQQKPTSALILTVLSFSKMFEVEYDAFGVGIGVVFVPRKEANCFL